VTWSVRRLDQLGYVSRGRSRHRPRDAAHLYDGPYPFIQTADIKHAGLYITEYQQSYSEAGLEQSRLWPSGTLCITIAANIADTAILGIDACFPDSVIGFIANPREADARFVKYLFDATIQQRVRQFTQGAAQDNLSQEKLLSIEFQVPRVDEQARIANVLSAYDDLIENNRRRMELLEESARQLYREWFVRLRFPGREHTRIINGVPEGWSKGRVSDLGEVITGKTPSTNHYSNYGEDIQFVKTPDMHRQMIVVQTEQSLSEKGAASQPTKFIPEGSILVACIGAKLGVVSLTSERCQTNQQINAVIPHDTSLRYYSFFALCDLRPTLQAMGGGATMPNVNKTKFSELPLLIPRHSLLAAFSDLLDPIFLQIRTLLLLNENLTSARDLLLPRLMSGEIAV
jgi:type I restriction enzyme, S subunit